MISGNVESDESIAERFKRDFNEQFHILVRMHLSFLLDINAEENDTFTEKSKIKKWNIVPFNKKLKLRGIMEGLPLTQEGICQVYQLIEYLKSGDNLKSEGIFRRTGSLERQQDLKNLLNKGQTLHLETSVFSVHDCASVLKSFLAELPEPLLTNAHFPVYCQIAESCGIIKEPIQEVKLLEALQLLFLLLPNENKILLQDIIGLLHLTASYENFNRMSSDNLAKLFTPHLLCPRKLSPQCLLKDSQTLFKIVSFMINKFTDIFKIPNKLEVDFRARYEKKKILSPSKRLNESISDAASTVFTFVDHERTTKENESNPTEKALAQLYAHIQTLPDSSKKRKLVKQFNKENGQGTPLQLRNAVLKNKTLGESIKKHLFQKGLARKKGLLLGSSSSEDILETPSSSPSFITKKLFCHHNHNSSNELSNEKTPAKRTKNNGLCPNNFTSDNNDENISFKRHKLDFDVSITESNPMCNKYLTSTPACLPLRACSDIDFTPEGQDKKSMSPITRSTQRMTRAMQETMMTPRSRKPVLVVSGTNINALPRMEQPNFIMDSVVEEIPNTSIDDDILTSKAVFQKSKSDTDIIDNKKLQIDKPNKSDSSVSLSNTFKEYLSNRDIITLNSPMDSSFSSRTDDFNSTDFEALNGSKITDSLLHCLDGNKPDNVGVIDPEEKNEEKKLVLKPKQFDEDGKPIIFETSF